MTLRINSFNSSHSVFQKAQKLHAKKSSQRLRSSKLAHAGGVVQQPTPIIGGAEIKRTRLMDELRKLVVECMSKYDHSNNFNGFDNVEALLEIAIPYLTDTDCNREYWDSSQTISRNPGLKNFLEDWKNGRFPGITLAVKNLFRATDVYLTQKDSSNHTLEPNFLVKDFL